MSILFDNPPPAIGCGDPGDPIDFSVFMDGNAHFSRNFVSGGNRRKCTFHFSVKLVKTSDGTDRVLFNSPQPTTGTNGLSIRIETDRIIIIVDDGSSYWVGKSASLLRDFAGWYSATVTIDTDQPDPENRFILDLDGVRKSLETTAGSIPAQGSNLYLVSGEYSIGRRPTAGFTSKFLGYLARFIYVDGIALPSAAFRYISLFGYPVNKRYTGAFGANGFHLNFSDPVDLGKDVSGNGNHFASSGVTVDSQVRDTPTNNCATFSSWIDYYRKVFTTSEGNTKIDVYGTGSNIEGWYAHTKFAMPFFRGLVYFELTVEARASDGGYISFNDPAQGVPTDYGFNLSASGATVGKVIGVIWDTDTGQVTVKVDNAVYTTLTVPVERENFIKLLVGDEGRRAIYKLNTGQWDFTYPDNIGPAVAPTAPNMPCPEILTPDDYVTSRVKLDGDDVTDVWDMTIGKSLVMTFNLDTGESRVVDTVRGVGLAWETNTANVEIDDEVGGVTAFTNGGFQVGNAAAYQGRRLDVMWRASPKSGMDIIGPIDHVTGTPTTVSQLTGGIVDMCLLIPLDGGDRRWYHRLLLGKYNRLNSSGDPVSDASGFSSTANTLTIGASVPSGRWMAYPFRAVPQFSAFPTYEGAANTDGAFVQTDFRPRMMLTDDIGTGVNGYPVLIDAALNPNNPGDKLIYPNTADGEVTALWGDFYSNGVKFRAANHPNGGYPYACGLWAQTPGKFARAR